MKSDRAMLKSLIKTSKQFIKILDEIMLAPSSAERGRKIAKLLNAFEMNVDLAQHSLDCKIAEEKRKSGRLNP